MDIFLLLLQLHFTTRQELNIPFVMIVDKDFFFDYKNDNLEDSRSETTGLPMYKDQLKSNDIIDSVFKTQ